MRALIACEMMPEFVEGLRDMGLEVDYQPDISQEEVEGSIQDYGVLVISNRILANQKVIEHGSRLRVIARPGSGMDNIDLELAAARGIRCVHSPEGNRNAVGEHTLAILLALLNKLPKALAEVRKGIWLREENRGRELDGLTVGIIGFGNTGSSFARKLAGFDVQVLAYDKYKSGFGSGQVKEVTSEEIFTKADVVSLHIPLTDETRTMVDAVWFSRFRKPVILMNMSRGGIVNLTDLLVALKAGKLAGACLDVLPEEPLTTEALQGDKILKELMSMENVLITPHIAGWTMQSKALLGNILLQRIADALHSSS